MRNRSRIKKAELADLDLQLNLSRPKLANEFEEL